MVQGLGKLSVLLELKDKLSMAYNTKLKQLETSTNRFKMGAINSFTQVKNSAMSMFGGGMLGGILSNPFIIAATAIAAFGVASVKAAEQFDRSFLEIRQMNLDKTYGELNKLQDRILELSFSKGLDPHQMSQAFFEVQSATGKFGKEVEDIVTTVGHFAKVFGADFGDSINSTMKAMKMFGFEGDKINDFMISNAKAVQVGMVSWKELAQWQVEYMGSAAALGQSFDTANKVFSAFTFLTKDARIAATMTKGAFEGLTSREMLEGFKKMKVEVFDASGGMRKLDDILADTTKRLHGMNDQTFRKLKSEIGGTEGLGMLMDKLKNSGDDFLKTLKQFDDTTIDMTQAELNARKNYSVVKNEFKARWEVLKIELGMEILPGLTKGFKGLSAVLPYVIGGLKSMVNTLTAPFRAAGWIFDRITNGQSFIADMVIKKQPEDLSKDSKFQDSVQHALDKQNIHTMKHWNKAMREDWFRAEGMRILGDNRIDQETKNSLFKSNRSILENILGKEKLESLENRLFPKTNTGDGDFNLDLDSAKDVVSGGPRNLTVNINKLVDGGINIHTTNLKEGAVQGAGIVQDELLRAVRNFELSH